MNEIITLIAGFALNLITALILVRGIYYPQSPNKTHVFTFLAFNTIIYFVITFLTTKEIGVGVGFGLFAIFSLLRYRTDPIPVREMTYLFIIVAFPVMNSTGFASGQWSTILVADAIILAVLWALEKEWGFRYESSKSVLYEKIELIQPSRYAELVADLEERTGLRINRVSVGKIDFLKDTANLQIFYNQSSQSNWENALSANDVSADDDD